MAETTLAAAPMVKLCVKCSEVKPLENFHRNSCRRDGHSNECKPCAAQRGRQRYRRNRQDPEWVMRVREQSRLRVKLWRAHNPEKARAGVLAYRQQNPHKIVTQSKLQAAVERGDIVKPLECSQCGQATASLDMHGHHSDYEKALEVQWLCRQCHGDEHRGIRLAREAANG